MREAMTRRIYNRFDGSLLFEVEDENPLLVGETLEIGSGRNEGLWRIVEVRNRYEESSLGDHSFLEKAIFVERA